MSCAKSSLILALPKESRKQLLRDEVRRDALTKRTAIASILLNKAKMDARKLAPRQQQEDMDDDDASVLFKSATDGNSRGKRRRLDHLTWEEKLQRKKMKNRVAAQTSRDRKKAKLDELELTVRTLTQECVMLRSQNESLLSETKRLRKELDTKNREERYCTLCQARVHCVVPSLGSAVSPNHPLPQGGTAQLASRLTPTPGAVALLKILTLYLLSKNFAATSKMTTTSSDSRNSRRVYCEKLMSKCKQLLTNQMNK
ncbi:X-box-binding protein 1 [Harpegnathos saltator]|uniref:X-box-binding protein 1 n=1 Tax=Harpegnathos saltator TaxID=610380 RepID=E2C8K2_HARSA|nr:X-box-binding protein 1 [Harpegnathos saltator]